MMSSRASAAPAACASSRSRAGRAEGADTVTVTRNEILTALNKPAAFVLAIVAVSNGFAGEPRYLRAPFTREPDFGATSVTYKLSELLDRAAPPS